MPRQTELVTAFVHAMVVEPRDVVGVELSLVLRGQSKLRTGEICRGDYVLKSANGRSMMWALGWNSA